MLLGMGPCKTAPKMPDIEVCGSIWTGEVQTSYGRCAKLSNPNLVTRRPTVEQMFKEKFKLVPLDDYVALRKWASEMEDWAKGNCR